MRDYAHKPRRGGPRHKKTGWLVIGGCLLGFVVVSLLGWVFYRSQQAKILNVTVVKTTPKKSNHEQHPDQAIPVEKTEQFEFYSLLPSMKMNVHSSDGALLPSHMVNAKYIVQVMAVQNLSDAIRVKNQLSNSGFTAYLVDYKDENISWHRVLVGPYATLSTAHAIQDDLRKQNMNSLIMLEKRVANPHIDR